MDFQEIEWTFLNLLASLHYLTSYREWLLEFTALRWTRDKTTESASLCFQAWPCHCLAQESAESLCTFRTQFSLLLISVVELDLISDLFSALTYDSV